jgi:septal ring factor EnvC (AmiA/AmiB activator)
MHDGAAARAEMARLQNEALHEEQVAESALVDTLAANKHIEKAQALKDVNRKKYKTQVIVLAEQVQKLKCVAKNLRASQGIVALDDDEIDEEAEAAQHAVQRRQQQQYSQTPDHSPFASRMPNDAFCTPRAAPFAYSPNAGSPPPPQGIPGLLGTQNLPSFR